MRFFVLVCLLMIVFSRNSFADSKEPVLSWDSYGQIKFGEKLKDVEKRLGEKANPPFGTSEIDKGMPCYFRSFLQYPNVVFGISDDDVVNSAEINEKVRNSLGIKFDDIIENIEENYKGKICKLDSFNFKDRKGCSLVVGHSIYDDNTKKILFVFSNNKGILIMGNGSYDDKKHRVGKIAAGYIGDLLHLEEAEGC